MTQHLAKNPPAGWRLFNGQLVPDPTVAGYLARGQDVTGTCDLRDCRRRFSIDFDSLIRRGYGAFPIVELKALLLCRRPGGCAMKFRDAREGSGLSLRSLTNFPEAQLRLRCLGCRWEKSFAPAVAISRLNALGAGGGDTLHVDILAKLSKPCPKCAKMNWASEVTWPEAGLSWRPDVRAGLNLARDRR